MKRLLSLLLSFCLMAGVASAYALERGEDALPGQSLIAK